MQICVTYITQDHFVLVKGAWAYLALDILRERTAVGVGRG